MKPRLRSLWCDRGSFPDGDSIVDEFKDIPVSDASDEVSDVVLSVERAMLSSWRYARYSSNSYSSLSKEENGKTILQGYKPARSINKTNPITPVVNTIKNRSANIPHKSVQATSSNASLYNVLIFEQFASSKNDLANEELQMSEKYRGFELQWCYTHLKVPNSNSKLSSTSPMRSINEDNSVTQKKSVSSISTS
jgi:hypothetical protein